MSLLVIEGTWEEIERRKAELLGHRLRVTIRPERPARLTRESAAVTVATSTNRPSALGKYAFVAGGSEEFAREKRAEIDREDDARG